VEHGLVHAAIEYSFSLCGKINQVKRESNCSSPIKIRPPNRVEEQTTTTRPGQDSSIEPLTFLLHCCQYFMSHHHPGLEDVNAKYNNGSAT